MGSKLIIDTDPGVDDAFAIALAARSDETELLGVTTVFGNMDLPVTTRNAARLLALCKRDDVPVAAGAAVPLVYPRARRAAHVHGSDGLSGRAHLLPPAAREPEPADAVSTLVRLVEETDEPVTVAAIGPLTNIAALLAAHPSAAEGIARLVVMGGALGHGNITAAAEFNIFTDPEAARRVLTGGELDCVLVPMDLTHRCAVDTEWLDTLAGSGEPGATLEMLTGAYRDHYRGELGRDGIVLHDAVAVAEAIRPGTLHTRQLPVDVECSPGPARGATVVDRRRTSSGAGDAEDSSSGTVRLAADTDLEALRGLILDRLVTGR